MSILDKYAGVVRELLNSVFRCAYSNYYQMEREDGSFRKELCFFLFQYLYKILGVSEEQSVNYAEYTDRLYSRIAQPWLSYMHADMISLDSYINDLCEVCRMEIQDEEDDESEGIPMEEWEDMYQEVVDASGFLTERPEFQKYCNIGLLNKVCDLITECTDNMQADDCYEEVMVLIIPIDGSISQYLKDAKIPFFTEDGIVDDSVNGNSGGVETLLHDINKDGFFYGTYHTLYQGLDGSFYSVDIVPSRIQEGEVIPLIYAFNFDIILRYHSLVNELTERCGGVFENKLEVVN